MKRDLKNMIAMAMILVPTAIILLWVAVSALGWTLGLVACLLIWTIVYGALLLY